MVSQPGLCRNLVERVAASSYQVVWHVSARNQLKRRNTCLQMEPAYDALFFQPQDKFVERDTVSASQLWAAVQLQQAGGASSLMQGFDQLHQRGAAAPSQGLQAVEDLCKGHLARRWMLEGPPHAGGDSQTWQGCHILAEGSV